jgi:hypothetical protein
MALAIEADVFETVSRHARFADLVALTRGVASRAARERALVWKPVADLVPSAGEGALREEDAVTPLGNAWTALEKGPRTRDEHLLLRALWAHALAESRPPSDCDEDDLVSRVVWLAAFTPFDATLLLDRALGDEADSFWPVLGERLRQLDAGEVPSVGRHEAMAAAAALRCSTSPAAARELARLAKLVTDPVVAGLLTVGEDAPFQLQGELVTAPRHPAATVAMALTGVLFVVAFVRVLARLALAYRRPADVTVTSSAVRVNSRTLVLGRSVRERDVLLDRKGLVGAACEVRFARAAFYAGLASLALGSLIGVRVFVDGVRAASPSLLFAGAVVVAAGIGLDLVLGVLGGGGPGRCRILLVSRDGTRVCVRDVDGVVASRALQRLAETAG